MIGDAYYERVKGTVLRLLKVPLDPPEAPAGSHASVEVFRASPRFLSYRMVLLAIVVGIVLVATFVGIVAAVVEEELLGVFGVLACFVAVAVFLVAHWFGVRVDYDLRYYVLTDRSLRVREGAWIVREKTLTYANVQNLDRHQGPIQRLLGISNLKVDTAGGGGGTSGGHGAPWNAHGATIAGVENAVEISERIRAHLRGRRDGGLGDPDDARGVARAVAFDAAELAELRLLAEEARLLRRAAEARARKA